MSTVKLKVAALFKDDRSIKVRLLIAVIVNFLFAFTFIIFDPMEIFFFNPHDFIFGFSDFWWIMVLVAFAFVVIASVVIALLKGVVFDMLVTSLFSLTVCSYIQRNFMNTDLNVLTGEPVEWSNNTWKYMVFLAIWLIAFIIPFVVRYFSTVWWKNLITYGAGLLVTMQAVALVFLLIVPQGTYFENDKVNLNGYILRNAGMFELSEKNNVVVFITDYFDNCYLDEILNENANFLSPLKGFTHFKNTASVYGRTYPSLEYLLTGKECFYDLPSEEYRQIAYAESPFLQDIFDAKFNIGLHTSNVHLTESAADTVDNYRENVGPAKIRYSGKGIVKALLTCVAYRNAPSAMKATFWFYAEDFNEFLLSSEQVSDDGSDDNLPSMIVMNDLLFYKRLTEHSLEVGAQGYDGCFRMYHMKGAHPPITYDESLKVNKGATRRQQSKGCFKIIYEYIRQLQEMGLYTNTTIIITADHGAVRSNADLASGKAVSPILLVKPAGAGADSELTFSNAPVSHSDFQATVIDAVGGDYKAYGNTFFEISENEPRTRYFYMPDINSQGKETQLLEYSIEGDVKNFSNWSLTGKEWAIKYSQYAIEN
ncbi:MAG TPA: hypothetical protein VFD25_05650 [Clostridia bacterium]|nr:hypothetical protein [Clostridia bacterium]